MNDVTDTWALIPLKPSSSIKDAHYDSSRSVIRVCFKSDVKYDYYGVPQSIINDWMKAFSAGRFLNRTFVRQENIFPCRKVVE